MMGERLESMEKYFEEAYKGEREPDKEDFKNVVTLIRNLRRLETAYEGKLKCLEQKVELLETRMELSEGKGGD